MNTWLNERGLPRLLHSEWVAGLSEVSLIAAAFVLSSWYWSVSEHIVHLTIFFLVLALWIERKPVFSKELRFVLPAASFTLFLLWLSASVAWSGAFHQSLSYALLVVLTGATAVMLGMIVGLKRVMQGLLSGVAFLSLHGLISPGPAGAGLFSNRSELAMPLGVGLLAATLLIESRFIRSVLPVLLTAYLAWAVWAVDILTTVIAVIGAFMVLVPIFHMRKFESKKRVPVGGAYLFAAIGAVVLLWSYRAPLLALVGEDSTMSLRTVIWAYYWEAVTWRPVIGPGWGNSYGWNPIERDRLQQVVEFFPAHNGFIDTALMLGIIGLGLLFATIASVFFGGLSRVASGQQHFRNSFIPALMAYLSLNDMMATSLPKFIGVYLVGLMVGLLLRDSSDAQRGGIDSSASRGAAVPG